MDHRDRMEIYIPVDAEVKSIPLRTLPNSVLKRMGLPSCDSHGSKKLTDSPHGIWICPAVIRRKGQKLVSHAGNGVKENMLSLLDRQSRSESGTFRMSFVSSNRTAYKVLKETMPGNTVSTHASHTSRLPHGSSPQTCQDAVVIYRGQIYLSIRKPGRRQNQQDTLQPQPASQSSSPSTSELPSKSPKELLNDNEPKKKLTRCEVTHSENKKGVNQKLRHVSSSKTAHTVPQSTDSVDTGDRHCHKDARDQGTEEAAVQEPDWSQPQEEVANNESGDREMQDLGGEEAESADQNSDMDRNVQIDRGEVDQSSTHSWIRREPLGAASSSTSLQNDFDFKELAQEEMIARMKARLRQNEAALNNLNSS